ncbi:lipoyl(octanoyl) transferase LipB [Desulfotalea psychrophila]|uniref:Octanoyltransferase n=1 Tax=Desulfotalea psychrophila (strain LSv54 / DSM 12343) TaxID=177439 RepID=LIPB_DESPS|nr:lipoyl(octanoyl) transferase LipB [Desulfotalea psychrophila]Q6ARJ9.1 RecName: Full=Octanoyltransferase; AltName: Full=Lipoate-protein ligase B; AltName: Full=Lipoyl/octanoyl transferase; AltName: Full=Octanoyl-[acyl-carrier-protein]-protein N-octanoyltransferase [Desulfotalea psychrophila LSv54]CAG35026.1 probable lipoate-protein ligase B (LipB) [Desulfotalea psychrophila LSv54]
MSFLVDLGATSYIACYATQQAVVARRCSGDLDRDCFLLTEHPPVYTLGKRGGEQHLHISKEMLAQKGIDVVSIERGGEITYHGPGQLVLYPILHLRKRKMRVTEYVGLLEETMIRLAADFGVRVVRNTRNAGVWTEDGRSKIGSIGIAIRHGVSFHGFAFNLNTDLEPFSWINPCGLTGVTATSLAREAGTDFDPAEVKKRLLSIVADLFGEFTVVDSLHSVK